MLNVNNSLFIFIDIQEKLVKMLKNREEILKNNVILAKTAKILQIPLIITEQYPKGLGQTIPELNGYSGCVIEKSAFSALTDTELKTKLDFYGRKKIILTGIESHICVYQTAITLLNEGFEVFVVKNATSSRKSKDYKTSLELMHDYGAKLTCVETVLFELLESSKHPNFKEIQALIK